MTRDPYYLRKAAHAASDALDLFDAGDLIEGAYALGNAWTYLDAWEGCRGDVPEDAYTRSNLWLAKVHAYSCGVRR